MSGEGSPTYFAQSWLERRLLTTRDEGNSVAIVTGKWRAARHRRNREEKSVVTRPHFALRSRMLFGSMILLAVAASLLGGVRQADAKQVAPASALTKTRASSSGATHVSPIGARSRPVARSGSAALAADPFALRLSPPQPIRSLQDTITGTIGIDATPVTLTLPNPGDTGQLTFNGTQLQRVFFKFTNNTIGTGGNFTVDFKLSQGGTQLFFQSWLAEGTSYHDTYVLPTTGPYTIEFLPSTIPGHTEPNTGSITTTLYDVPADWAPTLTPSQAGDATTFTTATPGQNAAPTLQASQGQRVFVYFTNNTISTSCSSTQNVEAWLEGEAGLPSPRGICQTPFSDYIDTVPLAAGPHTLKLDPEQWLTGSITATIYDVPPDATTSLTINGPSQNLAIPVRGQGGRAAFSGSAGQTVTVTFTNITLTQSCTFPIRVSIVTAADPEGTPIASRTVCIPGSSLSATLPSGGSYLVRVDPDGGQIGSVTLSLTAPLADISPRTRGVCVGRGAHGRTGTVCTADPVNSLTGAFTTSETDLTLASKGLAFAFTRSYTSGDPTVGRLGAGWTDAYAASLAIQPNGDALLHGDEGQQFMYTKQPDGSFVGATGALSKLVTVAGGYKLTRDDQVAYSFNSTGVLQSELDRNGQGLSFGYDGSGRLSTVGDASGHTVTFGYSGSGTLLTSVGSTPQNTVIYGYTGGQLTSVTLPDPDGPGPLGLPVTRYTYVGGRLETIVDPNTHTQVRNLYDATSGRVTQQTDANDKTTTFAWDAATQTATATDANNHAWKDVYQNNVLIKRISGSGETTLFEHDAGLDVSAVTSPDGTSTTTMVYDDAGNLLIATAPASLNRTTSEQ
jgi:YD repeat-containing protein